MRIILLCNRCIDENRSELAKFYSVSVRDDGRYEFECERGHRSKIFLAEQKYVVLFEIALHAIIDGYFREAVASATSSLERFYEFAIRVILDHAKVPVAEFNKSWSDVAKQSERQLGMFIAAYTSHFKLAPRVSKLTQQRNEVIHKGKIPSEEEAKTYLSEISGIIGETIMNLRQSAPASLQAIVADGVEISDGFCFLPSHLSPITSETVFKAATIESRLKDIRARTAATKSTEPRLRKAAIMAHRPI